MEWKELIESCAFLAELELTLDLWGPVPTEYVGLAFEKLCALTEERFDQDSFNRIGLNHPELFFDSEPVVSSLFFPFSSFFYIFSRLNTLR